MTLCVEVRVARLRELVMKLTIAFTMVVQPFTRPATPSQDCFWEEDRKELPKPQEVEDVRLNAELFEMLGVQGTD